MKLPPLERMKCSPFSEAGSEQRLKALNILCSSLVTYHLVG